MLPIGSFSCEEVYKGSWEQGTLTSPVWTIQPGYVHMMSEYDKTLTKYYKHDKINAEHIWGHILPTQKKPAGRSLVAMGLGG
jgi:hypothetical protein